MDTGRVPLNFYQKAKEIFTQYYILTKQEIENYLEKPNVLKDMRKLGAELSQLLGNRVITEKQYMGVGKLISNINEETARALASAAKITHVDMEMSEEDFCNFYKEICARADYGFLVYRSTQALPEAPPIDSRKIVDAEMPTSVNCEGLENFKAAAESINPEDIFKSWSKDEFETCLEILGGINFSLEKKLKLWELMVQEKVNLCTGIPNVS